jgi:acyl-CoA synthetase (NDP forming)
VAILTRGGGWGVITTDACEEAGLSVPPLPEELIKKLDHILPHYWSRNNPVDMAAVITAEPFIKCLEILTKWEGIDAVIALGGRASIPGRVAGKPRIHEKLKDQEGLLKQIAARYQESHTRVMNQTAALIQETGKPIISVTLGSQDFHKESMEVYGLASYPTPERAVRVLRMLVDYGRYLSESDLGDQ